MKKIYVLVHMSLDWDDWNEDILMTSLDRDKLVSWYNDHPVHMYLHHKPLQLVDSHEVGCKNDNYVTIDTYGYLE
jgi:hypothetical protein